MIQSNTNELKNIAFVDQSQFACNLAGNCNFDERTISYATGVVLPQPTIDPDIIFKECCYNHYVLADTESSLDFKNDYSSFYHQRQLQNETAEFFLIKLADDTEIELNNDDYGVYFPFGSFPTNTNLKGVLIKWKKVLESDDLGAGEYQIEKRVTIAGVDIVFKSLVFSLRQYTSQIADQSVRMDVVMDGRLVKDNIDFTGTGWKHSLRVRGFFGRREPQFEEDNLIDRTFVKQQISMLQRNEFKFQTNLIPSCVTEQVWDFMIFANHIYFNDYNLNNHSYNYIKFPVKFQGNDGTGYGNKTRKARLNLVFTDKKENNLKRNFS